ncbi:hypothetical protein [Acinetobacter sp.]|uniref:hypothetical protein n=1 Tax=Acinetobacter sp. TaxID=472 RepID=UPI00388E38AA
MKKFIFAILLSASGLVAAAPSDAEVKAYRDRVEIYIKLGQTPDQVAVSLSNYFGRANFFAHDNGWDYTSDISYRVGDGNTITFLATVATMTIAK